MDPEWTVSDESAQREAIQSLQAIATRCAGSQGNEPRRDPPSQEQQARAPMAGLVEEWYGNQQFFERTYKTMPGRIHVPHEDRVRRIDVWRLCFEEPEKLNPNVDRGGVAQEGVPQHDLRDDGG